MSQENVELAREYLKAFNEHGVDGTEHLRHAQIELYDPPDLPDTDRHVGEAAFRERVESYLTFGWDGQVRVDEYIDAGEEVVVVWRLSATGALGGVALDMTYVHIYLFEAGLLRRIRQYLTREEGLEAVGLRE